SMDYEVFILSRMREEYDRTGSTSEAVVQGIGRTGRLVTSAALILFLAFTSMASGPDTSVKMFATGLAAGILIDATIIRALIVPAVISLMGRWNWWLPTWPARMRRAAPARRGGLAAGEAGGGAGRPSSPRRSPQAAGPAGRAGRARALLWPREAGLHSGRRRDRPGGRLDRHAGPAVDPGRA